jgi:hypothetical protein
MSITTERPRKLRAPRTGRLTPSKCEWVIIIVAMVLLIATATILFLSSRPSTEKVVGDDASRATTGVSESPVRRSTGSGRTNTATDESVLEKELRAKWAASVAEQTNR